MLDKVSGKLSGTDATAVECDSVSFWTCEQRYWRLVLLKQFPQAKFFSSHLSWCVTFEWIWFSTTTCGRTEIKKNKKNNDWMIKSMNQPIILPPIESKHKMSDLISTDMSPFVLSPPPHCMSALPFILWDFTDLWSEASNSLLRFFFRIYQKWSDQALECGLSVWISHLIFERLNITQGHYGWNCHFFVCVSSKILLKCHSGSMTILERQERAVTLTKKSNLPCISWKTSLSDRYVTKKWIQSSQAMWSY